MKGICFKENMVKAVVTGGKTQTRRIIFPHTDYTFWGQPSFEGMETDPDDCFKLDKEGEMLCDKDGEPKLKGLKGTFALFEGDQFYFDNSYIRPRYQPREIIYLKEPYFVCKGITAYRYGVERSDIWPKRYWRNKRYMPEKYARFFIQITDVNVERLQNISEDNAKEEGSERGIYRTGPKYNQFHLELNQHASYIDGFRFIWETINGKDSWELNPWVWVYKFKLVTK